MKTERELFNSVFQRRCEELHQEQCGVLHFLTWRMWILTHYHCCLYLLVLHASTSKFARCCIFRLYINLLCIETKGEKAKLLWSRWDIFWLPSRWWNGFFLFWKAGV